MIRGRVWVLLVAYILVGLTESFSLTAFGSWLQNTIHMSPSHQATFYASVFVPWAFKPLFAWIAESFSFFGSNRRFYGFVFSLISACIYLLVAYVVRTEAAAFGVTVVRTTANGFVELILGLSLIDAIDAHPRSAGQLQSAAVAARAISNIIGLLMGIPLYPCKTNSKPALSNETAIALTAVFPIVNAMLCLWLPEPHHWWSAARAATGLRASINQSDQEPPSSLARAPAHRTRARAAASSGGRVEQRPEDEVPLLLAERPVPPVQHPEHSLRRQRGRSKFTPTHLITPAVLLLLTWAAVKDLMRQKDWLILLGCILVVEVVVITIFVLYIRRERARRRLQQQRQQQLQQQELQHHHHHHDHVQGKTADDDAGHVGESSTKKDAAKPVSVTRARSATICALVMFLVYAMPSINTQLESWYFYKWSARPCIIQWINLAIAFSRASAGVIYYRYLSKWTGNIVRVILIALAINALARLLYVPLVFEEKVKLTSTQTTVYAIGASFAAGLAEQCLMIALLLFATTTSARSKSELAELTRQRRLRERQARQPTSSSDAPISHATRQPAMASAATLRPPPMSSSPSPSPPPPYHDGGEIRSPLLPALPAPHASEEANARDAIGFSPLSPTPAWASDHDNVYSSSSSSCSSNRSSHRSHRQHASYGTAAVRSTGSDDDGWDLYGNGEDSAPLLADGDAPACNAHPEELEELGNLDHGVLYIILLSFLDFGDSVSGWATGLISSALGVTLTNYSGLYILGLIDVSATLAIVPVIYYLTRPLQKHAHAD